MAVITGDREPAELIAKLLGASPLGEVGKRWLGVNMRPRQAAASRTPRSQVEPEKDMARIQIYDTTLRDGTQAEDVAFTLDDKLRIAAELDDCGIGYVEGGWPGSNPRDEEFFARVRKLKLKQARVAAFGSTRRANVAAADDLNLRQLLKAETPVVTIVGKTWVLHVRDDLRISKDANLEVLAEPWVMTPRTLRLAANPEAGLLGESSACEVYETDDITSQIRH